MSEPTTHGNGNAGQTLAPVTLLGGKRMTRFEQDIINACQRLNLEEEDLKWLLDDVRNAVQNHRVLTMTRETEIEKRLAATKEKCRELEAEAKAKLDAVEYREKQTMEFCKLFEWLVSKGVSPDAAVRGAENGAGRWSA